MTITNKLRDPNDQHGKQPLQFQDCIRPLRSIDLTSFLTNF